MSTKEELREALYTTPSPDPVALIIFTGLYGRGIHIIIHYFSGQLSYYFLQLVSSWLHLTAEITVPLNKTEKHESSFSDLL